MLISLRTELRQIDAGLNGEAGVRQNAALVVRFKIIKVRAGAVNFVGDVVAGAMGKILAEARLANDRARRIVSFESTDGAVGSKGLLDDGDGGVARVAHGFKDTLLL